MVYHTPGIEIHLAQDVEDDSGFEIRLLRSPYSPKHPSPMAYSDSDADDFRPTHLLPPPVVSPVSRPNLGAVPPAEKKGMDPERFEQLLQSTRQGSTSSLGHARKDSAELRRQATLKAHHSKALERRALFLAKIGQPASPTATESPATPPESPAIFHFTLPSPGLQSPLAVFGRLAKDRKPCHKPTTTHGVNFPSVNANEKKANTGWTEEVDFRARARTASIRNGRAPMAGLAPPVPHARQSRRSSAHTLPSLDQITARLARVTPTTTPNDLLVPVTHRARPGIVHPALHAGAHRRSPSSPAVGLFDAAGVRANRAATSASASRLPAFLQRRSTPSPPSPPVPEIVVSSPISPEDSTTSPVTSSVSPGRQRRSLSGPAFSLSTSQVPIQLLNSHSHIRPTTPETRKQKGLDMVEKLRRRCSAPAELPAISRKDAHPVLSMKGGF